MTQRLHIVSSRLLGRLALATLVLSSTACVAQSKYDEVLKSSRFYQDAYLDQQTYVGELEAERAEFELRLQEASSPLDAAAIEAQLSEMEIDDPQIDAQLAELARIAASLGGAPGDVTPVQVEGGYGFSLKDSVLFPSGSDTLRPEGQRILLELSSDIASRPFQTLWVRGHTDSVPVAKPETLAKFPGGNLELSAARALKVAELMIGTGRLPAGSVAVAGLGSNRPVAPNDSAEGRRQNRRVEIFVLEDDPELPADASGPASE